MSLSIDTGPVVATSPASLYDPHKWPELVLLRRQFIKREITKDCRYLSRFVAEAEEMYQACGYASRDEMLAKGYEVDPHEMELAVQWLELNDPSEAIPLKTVLELARHGTNQHTKTGGSDTTSSIGRGVPYLLARLKRDGHTQLVNRVLADEISARQAAIHVGILKEKTTLEKLKAFWKKATDTEKNEFREWIK